ncbi:hypothetical protein OIU78_007220 [Salix suchowensis]|nr:hypothetical protein OIU78_007220 [Salix suchowensis]
MYSAMRNELNQIYSKITELEMDVSEHSLVINAIQPLDPSRRCYRMIGGVLVERTIKEVLPAVLRNKEGIEEVIARLNEAAERKKKEISDFEAKYKIRIRKSDGEVKDDASKKEGSSQGVLVGPADLKVERMKLCDCKVLSVLPGPFAIPGNYRLESEWLLGIGIIGWAMGRLLSVAAVNVMLEVNNHQDLLKSRTSSPDVSLSTDRQTETLKLEDEINQFLQALRVSQDAEKTCRGMGFLLKRNFLIRTLYQHLDRGGLNWQVTRQIPAKSKHTALEIEN